MGWKCLFCNTENKINMYVSRCDECNVEYFVTQVPPHYSKWELKNLTYRFENKYAALVLYPKIGITVLWVRQEESSVLMDRIEIPICFEIVKPAEAAALADRIYHMKAFL